MLITIMKLVRKKPTLAQIGLWGSIVFTVGVAWWVAKNYELTDIWIRQAGLWGPLIAVIIYGLLSLTPIPSDPLTVLVGVLYGWKMGFFISWMGNTFAAFVEYFIAMNVKDATRFDAQQKKLPAWIRKMPVNSLWFLIGVRFFPGIGGKMVSIMAGLYGVHWWRFLWTTALANVVGSTLYVLSGWGLVQWIHIH